MKNKKVYENWPPVDDRHLNVVDYDFITCSGHQNIVRTGILNGCKTCLYIQFRRDLKKGFIK